MAQDYLIVSTKILPSYLPRVIQARSLLESHQAKNVTEAARKAKISRSTYYKYKDSVYLPQEQQSGHLAVISLVLKDEPGSLTAVLKTLSDCGASILTISQSVPIARKANVMISMDLSRITIHAEQLIQRLRKLPAVHSIQLNAME